MKPFAMQNISNKQNVCFILSSNIIICCYVHFAVLFTYLSLLAFFILFIFFNSLILKFILLKNRLKVRLLISSKNYSNYEEIEDKEDVFTNSIDSQGILGVYTDGGRRNTFAERYQAKLAYTSVMDTMKISTRSYMDNKIIM